LRTRALLCAIVLCAVCAGAPAQPPAPVVVDVVAAGADTAELTLPASFVPMRRSALSVEAEGLVAELLIDAGDAVLEGTPLLRIRPTRKTLERDAVAAELARARAATQLATLKERRFGRLVEDKMTAQDSYDVARAELAQARAAERAAQAALARLDDEVARLELRAPFAGVISRKRTEIGEWVRPGDVVLELTEMSLLRLEFALPQQHFPFVGPGTLLRVRLDAYPDAPFELTVTRIVPVVREAGRTFLARARLPNGDGRYAPGMSGNVTVVLRGAQHALTVPVDAVVMQPDGARVVWRVDRAGNTWTARPVPVETGRRIGDRYEVVRIPEPGGLPAGTQVVVRGNERLQPGQAVRLTAR
jgi:RND family efflux transporter MFP subunit